MLPIFLLYFPFSTITVLPSYSGDVFDSNQPILKISSYHAIDSINVKVPNSDYPGKDYSLSKVDILGT